MNFIIHHICSFNLIKLYMKVDKITCAACRAKKICMVNACVKYWSWLKGRKNLTPHASVVPQKFWPQGGQSPYVARTYDRPTLGSLFQVFGNCFGSLFSGLVLFWGTIIRYGIFMAEILVFFRGCVISISVNCGIYNASDFHFFSDYFIFVSPVSNQAL